VWLCYCVVLKDVDVMLSVSICMHVGYSHCLCNCVVNISVYVDIKCVYNCKNTRPERE
jgi:hypothetical protein